MSWIRTALAGVAFLSVATVASAQGPQGGPQGGPPREGRMGRGGMNQMLFQGIDLTDAQKDQIQKINEKYRSEREALRPQGAQQPGAGQFNPPDSATRAKMDALRTKMNADFRAILTADQQKVFDKNIADMKARMDQRMKERPQG